MCLTAGAYRLLALLCPSHGVSFMTTVAAWLSLAPCAVLHNMPAGLPSLICVALVMGAAAHKHAGTIVETCLGCLGLSYRVACCMM